jgi:hypothetical protein
MAVVTRLTLSSVASVYSNYTSQIFESSLPLLLALNRAGCAAALCFVVLIMSIVSVTGYFLARHLSVRSNEAYSQ